MATVSIKDPTFQAGRIVKAYGEFKRRLTRIKKEVTAVYESLKPIETASNTRSYFLNAEKTYLYVSIHAPRAERDSIPSVRPPTAFRKLTP